MAYIYGLFFKYVARIQGGHSFRQFVCAMDCDVNVLDANGNIFPRALHDSPPSQQNIIAATETLNSYPMSAMPVRSLTRRHVLSLVAADWICRRVCSAPLTVPPDSRAGAGRCTWRGTKKYRSADDAVRGLSSASTGTRSTDVSWCTARYQIRRDMVRMMARGPARGALGLSAFERLQEARTCSSRPRAGVSQAVERVAARRLRYSASRKKS